MSEKSPPQVNWQAISALPWIGSMIDGLVDELEKQNANLQACRSKPHVLDNHTVGRSSKFIPSMRRISGFTKGSFPDGKL